MGIINPTMLLFSISGLLIVIMYFIKNKYVDYVVPSTSLWEKVLNEESNVSKFEKFKNRLIMYIQLLILLLLVLTLSGVYINSKDKVNGATLLFIDNSIMMDYSRSDKSNLEKAKESAIRLVEKSSDQATFTILDAGGKSIFASTTSEAIKNIKNIYQLNTNFEKTEIESIITAFRSSNEDGYIVVFSNNGQISGDKNYRYESMKNNIAISMIDIYKGNYNIELINYGNQNKSVELLLKLDNETIDVFNLEIDANSSKLVSGDLDEEAFVLSAKINSKDDIEIDNYASKSIENEKEVSLYLSESSSYIRDALILNSDLVISESVDGELLNEGFDIYVYDGVEPDKLPKTGSMLLINPPAKSKFVSGSLEKDQYVKLSSDDVNSFIEPFYVGVSKELNVKSLKTIGTLDGKAIIQKGVIGELNTFVMGFDILDTNLPLKYSFPVYIQNIIEYFIDDGNEDEVYIVSDKINREINYSDKEVVFVTREGSTSAYINIKWILALLILLLLTIEMEVFRREY